MAPPPELERLRAELDRIDAELLDRLQARIACCVRIGHVKRAHAVPMMQPHRIGIVQERAAAFADRHGIDREFMRRLYDLIIAETCRIEDMVIGAQDR
ncbi:chorismate mutase family protein [Micromonospora sp. KC723]|nr:chorismate mutase family protein [Micromonospora sp. KC723]